MNAEFYALPFILNMTNEQATELIIDILTFCHFQEVPHYVNAEGAFVYREDITYGVSRVSYKCVGKGVQICDTEGTWFELKPLRSLDNCYYLITRLSHILDYKFRHTDNTIERKIYSELQTEIRTTVLDLMRTLITETILKGLEEFLKKAKSTLDKLSDNQ